MLFLLRTRWSIYGEEIRNILLDGENIDIRTEALLFADLEENTWLKK